MVTSEGRASIPCPTYFNLFFQPVTMRSGSNLRTVVVRKGGRVLLTPENTDYPIITIDPEQGFSVWGTVTFVVHKV